MARKFGKLFKGDVFSGSYSSEKFSKAREKYETGVLKPTAIRTVKKKGKVYSQFYHKPVEPGELF